jgi:hypothetical protein
MLSPRFYAKVIVFMKIFNIYFYEIFAKICARKDQICIGIVFGIMLTIFLKQKELRDFCEHFPYHVELWANFAKIFTNMEIFGRFSRKLQFLRKRI